MGVVERIIDIAKAQSVTGVQIGDILGLSKSPLTDWKNGKSKPTLEQITVLCEYFAISSDYLLFGKKTSQSISMSDADDDRAQDVDINSVIALYEAANDQARQSAVSVLKYGQTKPLHKAKPAAKETSSFIQIKKRGKQEAALVPIVGKTAAGLPIEMIENDYGEFLTADHSIRTGDFGVIASGDSMVDANINDGDVVIVRPQPTVDNGEIALVSVGDSSTIKKFYQYADRIELAPMNDEHETQVYNQGDDVRILGKVITTIASV